MDIHTDKPSSVVMGTLRDMCAKLLSECTPEQQAFFGRIYPGGIESLDQRRLENAIDQCQRTIKKNQSKPK